MSVDYDFTKLGFNLRKLRLSRNKSQQEICFEIGISQRTYQRLETNELDDVKLSTIIKILKYFDTDFNELFK